MSQEILSREFQLAEQWIHRFLCAPERPQFNWECLLNYIRKHHPDASAMEIRGAIQYYKDMNRIERSDNVHAEVYQKVLLPLNKESKGKLLHRLTALTCAVEGLHTTLETIRDDSDVNWTESLEEAIAPAENLLYSATPDHAEMLERKYTIDVTRTEAVTRSFVVTAKSHHTAIVKAEVAAGNTDFGRAASAAYSSSVVSTD